jgi:uncharacterized protein (DUF488 family)
MSQSEPKHIFTSYFAKAGRLPKAVAITVRPPLKAFPDIAHLPALAPSGYILTRYKAGKMTEQEYTELYLGTLNQRGLTPLQVLSKLEDGAILVCYEGPHRFCHRHLAAGWLKRAGPKAVIIQELP